MQRGYDIHQKDKNGWTPLVWCIDMSATGEIGAAEAIVDYLVEQGAQTDYRDDRYADLAAFARSRDRAIGKHVKQLLRRQKKPT